MKQVKKETKDDLLFFKAIKSDTKELGTNDLVFSKGEFGIVQKTGKTVIHGHKFVKIRWYRHNLFYPLTERHYTVRYLEEQHKTVYRMIRRLE